MPSTEPEHGALRGGDGNDAVRLEDGFNVDIVGAWLQAEAIDVLDELDPDEAWGRPVATADISAASSKEVRRRLRAGEPDTECQDFEVQQLRQMMIYKGATLVGFSECAMLRRNDLNLGAQCRICLEGPEEEELLQACACRGSLENVHASCLVANWEAKGKPEDMRCGLCHQQFQGKAAEALGCAGAARIEKIKNEQPNRPPNETRRMLLEQVCAATNLWVAGSLDEAAKGFRAAIEGLFQLSGQEDKDVLAARHNLGLVLQAQGKYGEALDHIRKALAGFKALRGDKDTLTLKAQHNEGLICIALGKHTEAEEIYRRVLEARQAALGELHMDTLKTSCNLGLVLFNLEKNIEAADVLRKTLHGLEKIAGRSHPLALVAMQNLSLALSSLQQDSEEAISLSREAADGRQLALGNDSKDTFDARRDLGVVLKAAKKYDEAEQAFRQALQGFERLLGFEHATTQQCLGHLCDLLEQRGNSEEIGELKKQYQCRVAVEAAPLSKPKRRGPLVAVITSLYILPQFRKQGLGTAAMKLWKDVARTAGVSALELCVPQASRSSSFFKKSIGMITVAESTTLGFTGPRPYLRYAL